MQSAMRVQVSSKTGVKVDPKTGNLNVHFEKEPTYVCLFMKKLKF